MKTPRRRRPTATGAFLFPALVACLALFLGGCLTFNRPKGAPAEPQTLLAPRHLEVGRIHSYDAADKTAVIEFAPHYRASPFLAGVKLLSRDPATLEPSARLLAAPYRSGRMLGAYVESGAPRKDDEVVIPPEPSPAPAPAENAETRPESSDHGRASPAEPKQDVGIF
jgi:hypothetical protein